MVRDKYLKYVRLIERLFNSTTEPSCKASIIGSHVNNLGQVEVVILDHVTGIDCTIGTGYQSDTNTMINISKEPRRDGRSTDQQMLGENFNVMEDGTQPWKMTGRLIFSCPYAAL